VLNFVFDDYDNEKNPISWKKINKMDLKFIFLSGNILTRFLKSKNINF
jgi:hypothetical protein